MEKILIKINGVVSKGLMYAAIILGMLCLPGLAHAQPIGDPGGNPDGSPLAVPIDNKLNVILIALGIILTVVVYRKLRSNLTPKKG